MVVGPGLSSLIKLKGHFMCQELLAVPETRWSQYQMCVCVRVREQVKITACS